MTNNSKSTLDKILKTFIDSGLEKKAENVVSYDLQGSTWITDYVVIMGANNSIHCKALLEDIEGVYSQFSETDLEELYPVFKKSGSTDSGWFVIDLNSIVIHCVTSDIREFYGLDTFFEKQGVTYHH
jgi:ribosome-associated protein